MITITIANQKGGVGKTTTAVNLDNPSKKSTYSLFVEEIDPAELIHETNVPNLFLMPSSIYLAKVERALAGVFDAPLKLRKTIGKIANMFSFVIMDTPPSLGLLTVNALVTSDYVITFNERLRILGVLVTMVDTRTTLSRDATTKIKELFGDLVFEEPIGRSVRLEESPAFKEDIFSFAPDSKGAVSYALFGESVLKRLGK